MGGGSMTITKEGALASFYTVNKAPIKHLRVYFSPKQAGSGDPSPSNVREINGWQGININTVNKNLYPFLKPTFTTNVYYNGYGGWSTVWKIPDRTIKYIYSTYIDNTNGTDDSHVTVWFRDIDNANWSDSVAITGSYIHAG